MTITVDLPPDVAARLSVKTAQGQDVAGYVQRLAVREANLWDASRLAAWDCAAGLVRGGRPGRPLGHHCRAGARSH